MYMAPRYVVRKSLSARGACARRGVPAGCVFATTLIKLFTMEPFDAYVEAYPSFELDIYLDDCNLDKVDDEEALIAEFAPASLALVKVLEDGGRILTAWLRASVLARAAL